MRLCFATMAVLVPLCASAQTVKDLDEPFYRGVFTNDVEVRKYFAALLETDAELVAYVLSIQAAETCDDIEPSTKLRAKVDDEGILKSPYGVKVYLVTQKLMMPPEHAPPRMKKNLCKKLQDFIRLAESVE